MQFNSRCLVLVGKIPLGARRVLGRILGTLISFIPTRDRAIAQRQLEMTLGDKAPAVGSVYRHIAELGLEAVNLAPIINNFSRYVDFSEMQTVWDTHGGKRPIVAMSAHIGNWEVLAASASRGCGVPLTLTAREAQKPQWQEYLAKIRNDYGCDTVWRSDSLGTKQLLSALKRKRVVAVLLDQDTDVRNIALPFFDVPVMVPVAMMELGHRYNALFVTAFCVRQRSGKYRLLVSEIPDGLSSEEILREYHLRLESVIREYPNQWVWFHKRWRTLEDGSRLSSRQYLAHLENIIQSKRRSAAL